MSELNNAKARYFLLTKKADSALLLANDAKDIAERIGYEDGLAESYRLLSKIYSDLQNYESAIEALLKAQAIADSLEKSNNAVRLQILKSSYELEKSKSEEITAYQKKTIRQQNAIIIASVVLLALLLIVYLVFKNGQKQKALNEKLRKINTTKDRLFSIIGHDLREPFTTLQQLLELHKADEIDEKEFANLFPRLKQNIDENTASLDNLLNWAKTQMNGAKVNLHTICLRNKIEEHFNKMRDTLKSKGIHWKNEVDSTYLVSADPIHLDIILNNVISNAIKFSSEGDTITFLATTKGKHIAIKITDEGVGIQPSLIKSFQRGEVLHSVPGTTNEKGAGIGLQITKEPIEMNDGSITIEKNPTGGTTVTLRLPTDPGVVE